MKTSEENKAVLIPNGVIVNFESYRPVFPVETELHVKLRGELPT